MYIRMLHVKVISVGLLLIRQMECMKSQMAAQIDQLLSLLGQSYISFFLMNKIWMSDIWPQNSEAKNQGQIQKLFPNLFGLQIAHTYLQSHSYDCS